MIVAVKTKTNAKEDSVTKLSDGSFLIKTKNSPIEGKANAAIIKLLAKYFKTAQSNIKLKTGSTNKNKLFIISG